MAPLLETRVSELLVEPPNFAFGSGADPKVSKYTWYVRLLLGGCGQNITEIKFQLKKSKTSKTFTFFHVILQL